MSHFTLRIRDFRVVEPIGATDSYLHATGRNLWSVLANWKGAALRYQGRFD